MMMIIDHDNHDEDDDHNYGDHDHDVMITMSWNAHTPVQDKKVSSHDFSPTPY